MGMSRKDDTSGVRPTLKTIARLTELGTTTVSRALADAPDISQATKQRVRDVAKEIGYRRNRAGVRLRTGKTQVISLVLSLEEEILGITTPLVQGISEALADTDYHLVITPYSVASGPMEAIRYISDTGSADGIILSRIEPQDERVKFLHDQKIPFATHGRTELGIEHPYHDFDNDRYCTDAVKRLVSKKRKRLALLPPNPELTYYQHVKEGFAKATTNFDIDVVSLPEEVSTDLSLDELEQSIRAIMKKSDRPDGLVSCSAAATIAATAGVESAGLQLGRDIDIVSKQSINFLERFRSEIDVIPEDCRMAGRDLATAVVKSIDGTPATELQTLVYAETT